MRRAPRTHVECKRRIVVSRRPLGSSIRDDPARIPRTPPVGQYRLVLPRPAFVPVIWAFANGPAQDETA